MDNINRNLKFFKAAVADFKVAALVGSSKYLVNSAMYYLPDSLNRVIEYGPGDGAATVELLKRLQPDGKLLAIEANYEFIKVLKQRVNDPRLILVHGDVRDIASIMREHNFTDPEAVISSIPFSMLEPDQRDEIVKETFNALPSNGKFVVFHQYRLLMTKHLRKFFPIVSTRFEPRNVMPCFVFCASKK